MTNREPTTGAEPAISVGELSKTYTAYRRAGRLRRERVEKEAVIGVSFDVAPGEMVGYIGPNGAGKSTTIKMITGILQPTSGRLRVLGLNPQRDRTRLTRRLGVVFGQRNQLWWDLPLADSYALLHHLYRTDPDRHRRNVAELTERLNLTDLLERPVRQLSLGEKMRAELAAAFLHEPDLVVLDEPTVGLDVVAKYAVREFLADVNRTRSTTVLLTTHDLDDIEQLCERMILIDEGRVVLDGPLADFKAEHGRHRTVVIDLTEARPAVELGRLDAEVVEIDGPRQWIRFDRRATSAAEIISAVAAGHDIADVSINEPEIEDLIRSIYEDSASS